MIQPSIERTATAPAAVRASLEARGGAATGASMSISVDIVSAVEVRDVLRCSEGDGGGGDGLGAAVWWCAGGGFFAFGGRRDGIRTCIREEEVRKLY